MQMMPAGGPLEHYRQLEDAGEVNKDATQLAAVHVLQKLYSRLRQADNTRSGLSRLNAFFSRKSVDEQQKSGIYLWGNVGTGKTMLMDLFHDSLPQELGYREHYHRFMQQVHTSKEKYKHRRDPLALIAAEFAGRYQVICLDEFQVTDITDAMILSAFLENLFKQGMVLVITSNSHPDQLYADGLQRSRFLPAIELIKQSMHLLRVDSGHDYRSDFLRSDGVYRTPLNDESEASITACFHVLSGYHDAVPEILHLYGRPVQARAQASGVIWFDFDVLCAGARSNMDYIELARRYHTMILSAVPVLDSSKDDAARRFVELIDELYDRDVKFIVSAAVVADQLYQGKRLATAFKRTVSRLREMSSQEYLHKPHYSY